MLLERNWKFIEMHDASKLNIKRYFNDNNEAIIFLIEAIKTGGSASCIRLGDGEAKILGYPEYVNFQKVSGQMKIWFGEINFTHADILQIKYALLEAVRNSDVIGLPTPERCSLKDDKGELTNDAYLCSSMWNVLIEHLGELFFEEKTVVTATFHQWAQLERQLATLLKSVNNIGMISRTEEALFKLYDYLNMDVSWMIKIPGETWSREEALSSHYPTVYNVTLQRIRKMELLGSLTLVGAGVLGKIYCSEVKKSGGVAFDVGALIDGWSKSIPEVRQGVAAKAEKMTLEFLFDKRDVI